MLLVKFLPVAAAVLGSLLMLFLAPLATLVLFASE